MNSFGKTYNNVTFSEILENYDFYYSNLLDYKVLVFKNIDFGDNSVAQSISSLFSKEEDVRIYNKSFDDNFDYFTEKNGKLPSKDDYLVRWQTDNCSDIEPSNISCIYMDSVGDSVGLSETKWVNLENVYNTINEEDMSFILKIKFRWLDEGLAKFPLQRKDIGQEDSHPSWRIHPETGKPSIFYGGLNTLGKDNDKWQKHIYKLRDVFFEDNLNIFSITWEEKDLVIWDNRCTAYSSMGGFSPGQVKFTKVEAGHSKPVNNLK